jgi:hypothetical protein
MIVMLHLQGQTVPEAALLVPEFEGTMSLQNKDNFLPVNMA